MALVLIGSEVFQSIGKCVRTAQAEQVQDHVHELIHEQAMQLDLSFYDDPGYYDKLHRVRTDELSRPAALIENAGYPHKPGHFYFQVLTGATHLRRLERGNSGI